MDLNLDVILTERDQQRREYQREYMRKYRRRYPERERQAQIRKARNLLIREGWTVLEGGESDV